MEVDRHLGDDTLCRCALRLELDRALRCPQGVEVSARTEQSPSEQDLRRIVLGRLRERLPRLCDRLLVPAGVEEQLGTPDPGCQRVVGHSR